MERWLLTVETNCADPSREGKFNKWYDTVHLVDILETPGIVRASRYEKSNPAEGQGKYLAIYEIETENLDQTMAAFGERVNKIVEQGRMSELVVILGGGLYKRITAPIKSKRK
jgi:hypothetical protein